MWGSRIRSFALGALALGVLPAALAAQQQAEVPGKWIEVGFAGSLLNSYARGNVDDFMAYASGDPERAADQGSPSFLALEGVVVLPLTPGGDAMGVGFQLVKPAEHAIWGTYLYFGGRSELYFDPFFLNVVLQYRHVVSPKMVVVAEPGMDLAIVPGEFDDGSQPIIYESIGVGGHGAVGLNYMFNSTLGLSSRLGYRVLRTPATYRDDTSETGWSQTLCCGADSDGMVADWSGLYMTIGVFVSLGR